MKKQTLHEHQQLRLHNAVIATFTVEKKTFTDNIMKETTQMIIKKWIDWVSEEILTNPTLKEAAMEDKKVTKEREDVIADIKKMEKCLDKISEIM